MFGQKKCPTVHLPLIIGFNSTSLLRSMVVKNILNWGFRQPKGAEISPKHGPLKPKMSKKKKKKGYIGQNS